ncbi:hypothetical protein [Paenibacillus montanisoli]|uniref:Uncharacterized protein n=1 Tax=Paenibacillus montanisoli TaxID=2081970 RepID=A0A328UBA8_9BACL|nr:hypothetical protein [Paenibacillus montanisoli]RAP77326.1 hypothetical protein DL346_02185 [Paenibacillus montanisoli]
MYNYLLAILLIMLLAGCSGARGEEFELSGKITEIDKANHYVYVDKQGPIKVKDYDELEVGQQVTFVLYSTDPDDVWDPEKIKVKSVEMEERGLQGSIAIEHEGPHTTAIYTFINSSDEQITVIGGARYILMKDDQVAEKGSVPIKDYLDLQPGEEYIDKKTFSNLQAGSYTVQVEWNQVVATSAFEIE